MRDVDLKHAALELADRLDRTPSQEFSQLGGGDEVEGAIAMPFAVYAPIEGEWRSLTHRLGVGGPSAAYDRILQRKLAPPNLETIALADRDTLIGYATFIQRGERFCEGHIAGAHERGLLSAVLRRFAGLI